MAISNIFSDYIHTENIADINIIKIDKPKMEFSKDEAKQDFEALKAIMLYAYSGRQFWENKIGKSFEELSEKVEKILFTKETFNIFELCDFYHRCFKEFIIDNHLKFITQLNGTLEFTANKYAYFSDIVLEKSDENFFVVKSEYDKIEIGDLLQCDENCLYKTLSPHTKQFYHVGIRSWQEEKSMIVLCNNKEIELPLHKCRASLSKRKTWEHFRHEKFGNSLRSSKTLIWNLCNNGGGSSNYAAAFIRGLNEYSNFNTHVAILHSNYTDNNFEEPPYYKWEYIIADDCDYSNAKFENQLYVLMDSRTGSSGENAVAIAKSVKNCITIGENTYGAGVFGELKMYKLPHSNMILYVPSKIFLGGFEEGVGYEPDYWVDKENIQDEVIKWINSKDKYMP